MRESSGRRSATEAHSGRYVGSRIPAGKPDSIALDATLRATAPHQLSRSGDVALKIETADIREKIRERKCGNTILFVVDASGSMGAQQRMSAVKGAVLSLLIDAYQKRDKIGLIIFRGDHAELLLPLTTSVDLASEKLKLIPTGGKTPLGDGLRLGFEVLTQECSRNPKTKPLIILISDGKANVSISGEKPMEEVRKIAEKICESKIPSVLLDSEEGMISLGFAGKLAETLGAKYMKLSEMERGSLV